MTESTCETIELPGLSARGVTIRVPLDASKPSEQMIDVFARIYTAPGGENKPFLIYLQGGPGSEAPRVTMGSPSWIDAALSRYQVVMLDQRGTGRSTPLGSRVITDDDGRRHSEPSGVLHGMTAAQQAEYLTHMRADEIVNDCEAMREALGIHSWTVMGQSFGGFTTLTYMSKYSKSMDAAIFTGGLSAVGKPIDEIYATTWEIMRRKNAEFYTRFPWARERVHELMKYAADGDIRLPGGDAVSPKRLKSIGIGIGMQGGYEKLAYLLELDHHSPAFAHDLANALAFSGRNPMYSILHESCYADGCVTNWAAEHTMPDDFRSDYSLLSGEHMSHTMISEDTELSCFEHAAEILATHSWSRLYDEESLKNADIPVAAAIYANDAYVPLNYSLETAALLPDARTWVTSEYEHNGLHSGNAVITHLFELLDGERWL